MYLLKAFNWPQITTMFLSGLSFSLMHISLFVSQNNTHAQNHVCMLS